MGYFSNQTNHTLKVALIKMAIFLADWIDNNALVFHSVEISSNIIIFADISSDFLWIYRALYI